ncbi:Intermembrane phospholipid transport system permease protein MlaE [Rhodocyclaceae bacterium]|nr:Intermembrane phospholipid transport system permease protein MlaE [Rhodocyclaceae bacterium]
MPAAAAGSLDHNNKGCRVSGASLTLETDAEGGRWLRLAGEWRLMVLAPRYAALEAELASRAADAGLGWDIRGIEALDSVGAMLLWRAWGHRFPDNLATSDELEPVFARLYAASKLKETGPEPKQPFEWIVTVGSLSLSLWRHLMDFTTLVGQLMLDLGQVLRAPREMPWRESSANLYKSGVRAMPVTALVGFLIGIVLSYLSALQLKNFGADIFIVNILGMGIIRELGPVLVAVLVAGRSGSAMTAQLGVMRVTEEIDALATMGVSRSLRLVFPKVAALALAMPLLVLWTSSIALMGGMVSAQFQLDISYGFFIETLPKVVPVANLYIALAKGVVFGILVALVACHFGLRVRPNTESLSANTTASVVSSITVVILVDAVFAIATRSIGMPT